MNLDDLSKILPEILLALFACGTLLLGLNRKMRADMLFLVATLGLLSTFIVTLLTLGQIHSTLKLFNGLYVVDTLGTIFKLFALLIVAVSLTLSREYLCRQLNENLPEYLVLVLISTLGMLMLMSSAHFLLLYLGLELMSLALYALTAIVQHHKSAIEAATKYFVLGALGSGLLLFGISFLFGLTGTLHLAEIGQAVAHLPDSSDPLLLVAIIMIIAGIGFKLGVAPFHMWLPDVYTGAATPVTLFIATAPKLATFILAFRFFSSTVYSEAATWSTILAAMAVLSIVIGNFAAIAQRNIKRMLGYSTIAHMGFLLLAFTVVSVINDPIATNNNLSTYTSLATFPFGVATFYTLTYVIMTTGTFGILLALTHKGFESEHIEDFSGLAQRDGLLAFIMLVLMFSLAGIPFFVGFYSKAFVISSLISHDQLELAVFAMVMSVVGAFYYLRIVKIMYFDPPREGLPNISCALDRKIILSLIGCITITLGLFPSGLLQVCMAALTRSIY